MKEKNISVAILDSGINLNHSCFDNANMKCYLLNSCAEITEQECPDEIGHGTAVTFIIHKHLPMAKLLCFQIIKSDNFETDNLIRALQYIYDYIDCDLINISLGTTCCDNLGALKTICEKLTEKGIIIISAFDNSGIISYPAAFPNVIGVDVNNALHKVSQYEFVENSSVNIFAFNKEQNLPWLNNRYKLVSGASFAVPHITAFIGKMILSGICSFSDIMHHLRNDALHVINSRPAEVSAKPEVNSAILFPFNKEMHSLARFENLLSADVKGIFDVKYIGNIGKKVSAAIGQIYGRDYVIQNYLNIDWEDDFETVILGHTSQLSRIIGIDFEEYFVNKCMEHHKKVFSFAALNPISISKMSESQTLWYYPCAEEKNIPDNTFGKLRRISKPVIGVVGTSQRQGKFTLQLKLKMLFEQSGYKIGFLGTEPSSLLFGADEVYPMGYESTVHVSGYDAITYINSLMGKIEDKNPDLILVGSQSQTIPVTDGWIGFYPLKQHELLLACAADCYILCVNIGDELAYIKRTINYLENILPSKVLCLALFPFELENKWSVIGTSRKIADKQVIQEKIQQLRRHLKKKVFHMLEEDSVYKIANECIQYFS